MIEITEYHELVKFLDSLKRRHNFYFYKTITTLSKSMEEEPRILVASDTKMLSGDHFCKKCHVNNSSVDGVGYCCTDQNPFILILIEFKFISKEKFFGKTEETGSYRDNIKLTLKLKPLETLLCIFPHLIKKYGEDYDEEILVDQLIQAPKIYIFVTSFEEENKTREHRESQGDYFDLNRLSPHPFDKTCTLSVNAFESFITDFLS